MNFDVHSLARQFAGLAWVALRYFVGTVLLLTLAGIVLAACSYYVLRDQLWVYGVIAVIVALIESVAAGVVLGVKRAVVMAAAHGLGSLRLGGSLVRVVFERMLGIAEGEKFGERGGQITRTLERLPLAQAQELLNSAVRDLTGAAERGGWLQQKLRARLLKAVHDYTLARFRAEGAEHGGIDLLKVKEELEATVDDVLVHKLRAGLRFWTTLVILGLPLTVAGQTYFIILLLHSKG